MNLANPLHLPKLPILTVAILGLVFGSVAYSQSGPTNVVPVNPHIAVTDFSNRTYPYFDWSPFSNSGIGGGRLFIDYGPDGVAWDVELKQNGIKGVWINVAKVRRPHENTFTKVLGLTGIAELSAAYDSGPCFSPGSISRFHDMNHFSVINNATANDLPVYMPSFLATLRGDTEPKLVIELRDLGAAWVQRNRSSSDPSGASARLFEVVAWSTHDSGNYEMIMQYGFRNDGSISLRSGLTGFNHPKHPSTGHMHNPLWFVHFDLFGNGVDSLENHSHTELLPIGAQNLSSPLVNEGAHVWNANEYAALEIHDHSSANYHGNHRGYSITPHNFRGFARHYGANEDWTQNDFYVTQWNPAEYGWMNAPTQVLPDDYLLGSVGVENPTNPVIWYHTSALHIPHDEDRAKDDLPDGVSGVTGIHWSGLDLTPANFFDYNPVGGISATIYHPLPDDCIAWWKFDCAPPIDSLMNRLGPGIAVPAILYGGATVDTELKRAGGALNLHGQAEGITLPFNPSVFGSQYLDVTTGDFTIEAEVLLREHSSGVRSLLDKRNLGVGYLLYFVDGRFGMQLANGTHKNFTTITPITLNEKAHIAAVVERDALNNIYQVRLYVDGVLQLLSAIPSGPLRGSLANAALMRFGQGHNGEPSFDGVLDELTFYSRALTATEIVGIAESRWGKSGGR